MNYRFNDKAVFPERVARYWSVVCCFSCQIDFAIDPRRATQSASLISVMVQP